ncbi:MAG: inorganic diphosphatase [Candidatus Nomurabacteria bacterium]
MNLLHDISHGDNIPNEITVIVEINKGSLNKYELDKETGLIKLDRVSHTSQTFPFDYGFVPQTHWYDGDPLDVIIIATAPLIPGILVDVRPVAVMDMIDSGESDAKIVAVPIGDPRFGNVHDLADVNPHFIKEVTHFYENYKKLQNKVVTIPTVRDAKAAKEVILESIELYKKEFKKS